MLTILRGSKFNNTFIRSLKQNKSKMTDSKFVFGASILASIGTYTVISKKIQCDKDSDDEKWISLKSDLKIISENQQTLSNQINFSIYFTIFCAGILIIAQTGQAYKK
jgi:hypothetical protein